MAGFTVGADQVGCQVWVSMNQSTIIDDYNVASITDTGTGNYTVTFTTSLASATYGVSVGCGGGVGAGSGSSFTYHGTSHSPATGSCGVNATAYNLGSTVLGDPGVQSVLIFGN